MKVIVTGGAGYIGSVAVNNLIETGNEVIVIDDLSLGSLEAVNSKAKFYLGDIRDEEKMLEIFNENSDADLVMDFAAKLNVAESVEQPLEYYDVNVNGLRVVLKSMEAVGINKIIFSSTAAVYGMIDKGTELINENDPIDLLTPYGSTKYAGERMIQEFANTKGIQYVIFRYFNVAGGRKIGVDLETQTTIIPAILTAVKNGKALKIFGNDYPTPDGTCVRDYIHVNDLVDAHVKAANGLYKGNVNSGIYNLAIGRGISILELIEAAETAIGKTVEHVFTDRRPGDPSGMAADGSKAMNEFGWTPKWTDVEAIIKDAAIAWDVIE